FDIPLRSRTRFQGLPLVLADNDLDQNGPGADLHAGFQLNNGGEVIALYSPAGVAQHVVIFGPQIQNVSQGLFPDGNTNTYYFMTNWTPRAANTLDTLPTPQISQAIAWSGDTVSFSFATAAGRTYRVEYKDDLGTPGWTPRG